MAKKSTKAVERILKELWDRVVKKHPSMDRVSLAISESVHDSPRHYAAYLPDTKTILLAPQALRLSAAKLRGLLAHELGHAIVHQTRKREPRGYDARERQADREAEKACGLRIRYGTDKVQSAGHGARGTKRPKGLR